MKRPQSPQLLPLNRNAEIIIAYRDAAHPGFPSGSVRLEHEGIGRRSTQRIHISCPATGHPFSALREGFPSKQARHDKRRALPALMSVYDARAALERTPSADWRPVAVALPTLCDLRDMVKRARRTARTRDDVYMVLDAPEPFLVLAREMRQYPSADLVVNADLILGLRAPKGARFSLDVTENGVRVALRLNLSTSCGPLIVGYIMPIRSDYTERVRKEAFKAARAKRAASAPVRDALDVRIDTLRAKLNAQTARPVFFHARMSDDGERIEVRAIARRPQDDDMMTFRPLLDNAVVGCRSCGALFEAEPDAGESCCTACNAVGPVFNPLRRMGVI